MFYFIFIFNSCFNNSNCAMALKHYDFELRANLFNDVKVDENFCPLSVCDIWGKLLMFRNVHRISHYVLIMY